MKHRALIVLFLALLLTLSGLSVAVAAPTNTKVMIKFGAGDHFLPEYPDMTSHLGNYTLDDVNVSYRCEDSRLQVAEDGTLYLDPADWEGPFLTFRVIMTYQLKKGGRPFESYVTAYVYGPFDKFIIDVDEIDMAVTEQLSIPYSTPEGAYPDYQLIVKDESIVSAKLDKGYAKQYYLDISGLAPGETEVILRAYNGLEKVIPVKVYPKPTWIDVTPDVSEIILGESVVLDVKMDTPQYKPLGVSTSSISSYIVGNEYGRLLEDERTFQPVCPGVHYIRYSTFNHLSDAAIVYVYSPAESVTLKADRTILNHGDSQLGKTYLYMYDENGREIYCKTTIEQDGDVIMLTGNKITALGQGVATITATTPSGATDSITITVGDIPTKITLDPAEVTLNVGDTFQINAIPDKGTAALSYEPRYEQTLSQSNMRVATVTKDGLVTATAPGTAEILVRANYSVSATLKVTVLEGPKAIEIIRPEGIFAVGDTFQLSIQDGYGNVYPARFESSDDNLTVTEDGLLTGVSEGSGFIDAYLEDGTRLYYEQKITRVPSVLTCPDMVIPINHSEYIPKPIDSDMGSWSWSKLIVEVENENIVTFRYDRFYPQRMGSTRVTVTSVYGNASATFTLTVTEPDGSIYPDKTIVFIATDQKLKIPDVRDYYGNVVNASYTITEEMIGFGNPNEHAFTIWGDYITCHWPSGTCTVTCTSAAGFTCEIEFRGYTPATRLSFQRETIDIHIGESDQVALIPSNGSYGSYDALTWIVEDESVIRFEPDHPGGGGPMVKGLKAGTSTITAVMFNGTTATCTVHVSETVTEPDPDIGLSIYTASNVRLLKAGSSLQFLVDVSSLWDSTEVTWSISDETAGSITQDGLFTAAQLEHNRDVTIYATSKVNPQIIASYTLTIQGKSARVPGDANSSGTTDIFDATAILQYDVGWDVTINKANADVNADDEVNVLDALLILQYEVGWNVTLQ